MLNCHYFFRNSLCLILTLSLILLPAGCCKQAVDTDDSPVEMHKGSSPKVSQNTISSTEYTYSPSIKFLDDDELLRSLGLQTFQLDCPTASSNDTVFVQLQLPEQWTQDDDIPTLFYFPDGSNAMQLEILPLEQGQCIWSAERLWEDESCISYSEKYIHYSWYTFQRYTFYSIHTLDEQNLYDYTYYLPYGSAYFAVHFYTYGESNENALRFQKGFLETIQLLTPIPEQVFAPSFWRNLESNGFSYSSRTNNRNNAGCSGGMGAGKTWLFCISRLQQCKMYL